MPDVPSSRTSAARLRQARRQLLERGDIDAGLIDPALQRSWLRSAGHGLAPVGRALGAPHASAAQLARALQHQRELVAHARPVMEYLAEHTRDSDSMVILADAQGLLLHALGDPAFIDRAQRVALRPGAIWHEQWRGTNAIGTALADAAPRVVHAAEHFLERNGFLTCTAAPISDGAGRLLGVLDISGDRRSHHHHTLALVRSAARMIEQRLFDGAQPSRLRLRLHAQPEGVDTLAEGLLALDETGGLAAADAAALRWLGLRREQLPALAIGDVLALDLPTLAAWARQGGRQPRRVLGHDGRVLWLRVEGGSAALRAAPVTLAPAAAAAAALADDRPAVAVPAGDALEALDRGDAAMRAAVQRVRRVLDKPIALLLQGESGVGKEVFARAVHAASGRRAGGFVAVNCAALPEPLIEAELFGHRPGAYTGAAREGAQGRIREAHGGTLFLDEIGDMPLALQARLLRVLQDREVTPLGGGKPVAVDFRLICATHRQLREAIAQGRFREDLYYRLNGLTLTLPPLRERQDLSVLVADMLRSLAPERPIELAPELAQALARYAWPGNLRQLHQALQTACALLEDDAGVLDWSHLSEDLAAELHGLGRPCEPPDEATDLRALSGRAVRQALAASGGNLTDAARRLGISRNTLYRKLGALGLR